MNLSIFFLDIFDLFLQLIDGLLHLFEMIFLSDL